MACALHLDECPVCSNRQAALEPLALAFASCMDPEVPEDLVPAILRELRRPPSLLDEAPVLEMVGAAGLLAAAAAILVAYGEPLALATDLALQGAALARSGWGLARTVMSASNVWMPLLALAAFASSLWLATRWGRRRLRW